MAFLLLFVDGVGVGRDDPGANPFAAPEVRRLGPLAGRPPRDGAAFRALDATLGVPGLPQSATGQTTLFTGVNAAALLGRHQVGLPGPSLHPLLARESLFLKLTRLGKRPTLANAYPASHLSAPRPRLGTTTRIALAAGVRLRSLEEDEPAGAALVHDYRARTPEGAAGVLVSLLDEHDLVLYEYFLTDLAAHRGTREQRWAQARRVDALVDAVLRAIDLSRHGVLLVSDHGNLEEAGHDRHTLHPVPLLGWGAGAAALVAEVAGMDGLTPALVRWAAAA